MYNEVRIPFSLADLPEGESIALAGTEGFIPHLTEKWPGGGRPDHVEMSGPRDPVASDFDEARRLGCTDLLLVTTNFITRCGRG
jgi:hypothetical protein